jgi:hypothetical protein
MVGLHVLHDEIVRGASSKRLIEICPPLITLALVDGVHYSYFLILNEIGIIGYAVRYYILTFEKV